ncbi:hypothetical protein KFE25_008937 [Diacronema lutheri]|uniref:tRNA dimethylallyltransferase n=1 Tax=Diacronema lutheri TaxID=2081491 RepID=A0A8J5XJR5_DIALT|nr:hypothetical protein KFE25_008937 [Diacronema lutheri]
MLTSRAALLAMVALSMACAVACRRSLRSVMRLTGVGPPRRPVIVIAGPTGVGKSDVAMQLAARLGGEIISVDSVQVYRSLDVGSNKPSAAEMRRVRHHLVSVREPSEPYAAGNFYRDAADAIADVHARGRWAICVGGTSMYMHWLINGTPTAPKADPALAAQVAARLAPLREAHAWDDAIALLRASDPERAAALGRNDWYRLMRALTIAAQTSTPLAELRRDEGREQLHELYDLRAFFLVAPREQLARRIDARCERMLADGLLRETSALLASGELHPDSQPGRAVGYRQAVDYLIRTDARDADGDAFLAFARAFTQASRAYAAQQMKWFRKEPAFEWLEISAPTDVAAAATQVELLCALSGEADAARRASATFADEQALAHRRNLEQGKAMKQYVASLPALDEQPALLAQLVAEADACRADLARCGRLAELQAARQQSAQDPKPGSGVTAERLEA